MSAPSTTASPGSTPEAGPPHRSGIPTWVLKVVMAISGIIWAAFVLVHLVGNLKVYSGAESFDGYAHWLREVGYPLIPYEGVLWALRVTLLVALAAHVGAALILFARARRARGTVSTGRSHIGGTRALGARLMLPTGILILAFVLIHLLDLTLGVQPVAADGGGSPYANLVASFTRPWAAAGYALAMLAVAAHVAHGTAVAVNDLGATGLRLRQVAVLLGAIAAIALLLGNASIPVAVQIGALS